MMNKIKNKLESLIKLDENMAIIHGYVINGRSIQTDMGQQLRLNAIKAIQLYGDIVKQLIDDNRAKIELAADDANLERLVDNYTLSELADLHSFIGSSTLLDINKQSGRDGAGEAKKIPGNESELLTNLRENMTIIHNQMMDGKDDGRRKKTRERAFDAVLSSGEITRQLIKDMASNDDVVADKATFEQLIDKYSKDELIDLMGFIDSCSLNDEPRPSRQCPLNIATGLMDVVDTPGQSIYEIKVAVFDYQR